MRTFIPLVPRVPPSHTDFLVIGNPVDSTFKIHLCCDHSHQQAIVTFEKFVIDITLPAPLPKYSNISEIGIFLKVPAVQAAVTA